MTAPITPATGAAAPAAAAASGDPQIREAAEGFEGIFMSMLVEQMMKGTQAADANPLYAGLATQKLGDELARQGGIGLADVLVRQLGGAPDAPVGS